MPVWLSPLAADTRRPAWTTTILGTKREMLEITDNDKGGRRSLIWLSWENCGVTVRFPVGDRRQLHVVCLRRLLSMTAYMGSV